jgi:hypothetical protein
MQGLSRKLADLDSDAERGVQLIEFFDQLVVHGADLEAIVRASAVLAEGAAGAIIRASGAGCVVGPDGELQEMRQPPAEAVVSQVRTDGVDIGCAWIERDGARRDWDELIVDRMALTVAVSQSRRAGRPSLHGATLELSDPAVVQVLLDPDADEVERSRCVRLLGFAPGQHVDVIAVRAASGMHQVMTRLKAKATRLTERHAVGTALSDTLGALLIAAGPLDQEVLGGDVWVCVGDRVPVEESAQAWRSARQGVRLAALDPRPGIVRTADLGCLVLLPEIPAGLVKSNRDVAALLEVASRRDGDLDIRALQALCAHGSVREAAKALHMHHSTLSYRLNRVSKALGFEVGPPQDRDRLGIALLLWGLAQAAAPAAPRPGLGVRQR